MADSNTVLIPASEVSSNPTLIYRAGPTGAEIHVTTSQGASVFLGGRSLAVNGTNGFLARPEAVYRLGPDEELYAVSTGGGSSVNFLATSP